ncbi:MAG: hypothetical protein CL678_00430 [Bdellovibrionaceae bacterium]|nr:hypothetical protein [Pseudobdellovibrionaceae bacterium]|tara:strand:- start:1442 stop:1873 length:432 start_codon:yes stop_codon:yes gene_type:complete
MCEEGTALLFILIAVVITARRSFADGSAAWLGLSSVFRLLWSIPVLCSYIRVESIEVSWRPVYTRQLYFNAEVALLGLLRLYILEPQLLVRSLTSLYLWTGVGISVAYCSDANNPAYTVHDGLGVALAIAWWYAERKRAAASK